MTQTKAELLQTRHQGDIRLGDADSTHYVGFKAPATVGTSLVWTLPAADGTAGYYLKTDGSGNLGWSLDNSGVSLSGSTNNTSATVTGANALQGEANLVFDGTNLGINCTPSRELHVKGLDVALRLESTSATGRIGTEFYDTSAQKGFFGYPSSGNDHMCIQQNEAADFYIDVNGSERIRINSAGEVGIGTNTPQAALEVVGEELRIRQTANSSDAILDFYGSNTSNGAILRSYGSDGSAGHFYFRCANSTAVTIDSSRRLILNAQAAMTTSSNRLLQVVGDTNGGGVIALGRDDGTLTNESLGGIEFYGNDPGAAYTRAASIMCEAAAEWTSSDYPTKLIFKTTPDGSSTNTTALTLDSSQNATFGAAIYGPAKTVGALELDLSTGNYFIKTISGNSTFTFANPAASGTVTAFTLELTHSSGTVTWPSSVKWNADTAPTLTTGKTHLFMFVTDDGGSRYRGSALVDYVN